MAGGAAPGKSARPKPVKAKLPKPKAGRPERLADAVVGSLQHRRRQLALASLRQPEPAATVAADDGQGVQALKTPDWLHHTLTITGLSATLAAFRMAARGPGLLPFGGEDQAQEDWMHLLLAPLPELRGITVEGARILAGLLREQVEVRAQAAPISGAATASALDLHALVPMPHTLLRLGSHDPRVLDWLWTCWGTTWPLRQVVEQELLLADRQDLPPGHDGARYEFWSADWTPWRALAAIRSGWPDLTLRIVVHYGLA